MKHGYGHNPLPAHLNGLPSFTLGTWFASVGVDIAEVYTHVFSHTTPDKELPLEDDVQARLRRLENGKSFTKTIDGQDRAFIKFNGVMGVTYRTKSPQHVRMLLFIEETCADYYNKVRAGTSGGGSVFVAHTGLGGSR